MLFYEIRDRNGKMVDRTTNLIEAGRRATELKGRVIVQEWRTQRANGISYLAKTLDVCYSSWQPAEPTLETATALNPISPETITRARLGLRAGALVTPEQIARYGQEEPPTR